MERNSEDNSIRINNLKKEVDMRLRLKSFFNLVITDGENAIEELKFIDQSKAIEAEQI